MNYPEKILKIERRIKYITTVFIICLALSGITAFPLESELKLLHSWSNNFLSSSNQITHWINYVYEGVQKTNAQYPFMAYGTDWLAFSHLVIAVFFIGLFKDPVRNKWIVDAGVIACIMVIPLALITGPIRGIPIYWRLIDCSFGVVGIIPLISIKRSIINLEKLKDEFYQTQLYNQTPSGRSDLRETEGLKFRLKGASELE
jgi:hypothetical protein